MTLITLGIKKDLELHTNKTPKIISEEKFDSFRDMAKKYNLELRKAEKSWIVNRLKERKTTNFEKKAEFYVNAIEKLARQ